MRDEAAIQLPLLAEAKKHTETLLKTLLPQLRRLGTLAQLYNRTSVSPAVAEKACLDAFAPNVTTIIQMALNLNLQLLATGYSYTYIWPSNGDDYDPREMKIAGAEERLPLAVRVTVFPGLKVSLSEADHASFEMVSEAAVRVQRPGRPRS
jgi:DNA-binding phage protein